MFGEPLVGVLVLPRDRHDADRSASRPGDRFTSAGTLYGTIVAEAVGATPEARRCNL
jgi:hypothetical protein